MLTDERKAQLFDWLIDDYCEIYGPNECIAMLRNHVDMSDQELVELGFDVNDL